MDTYGSPPTPQHGPTPGSSCFLAWTLGRCVETWFVGPEPQRFFSWQKQTWIISTRWWLNQPFWKIWVKLDHFPRLGWKLKKNENHHLVKLDLWVKVLFFQHKEMMYVFFQATPFLTSATYLLQLVVLSPRIRGTVDYTQRMPQKSPRTETNFRSFGRNCLKLWNFMILFLTFSSWPKGLCSCNCPKTFHQC